MNRLNRFFKRYKIKANRFYVIVLLTLIEMLLVLWINNWIITPLLLPPLIQFILIFENRDVWMRLSSKERANLMGNDDIIIAALDEIRKIVEDEKKEIAGG